MINTAISSAHKHGIKLKPGSPNTGAGDCAFEAVIQNNNDRSFFATKYKMPIPYYRHLWTIDMANRTVDSPWNTVVKKLGTKDGRICQFLADMRQAYLEI